MRRKKAARLEWPKRCQSSLLTVGEPPNHTHHPDFRHEKHETHEIPSRGAEVRRNKAARLEWARGGAQPEVCPQMAQIYADFGKEFPDLRGISYCVAGEICKKAQSVRGERFGPPLQGFCVFGWFTQAAGLGWYQAAPLVLG